jgi:hypothetical protein
MTTGPALCRGLLPEANAVALDVGANIGVTAAVLRTVKLFEHFAYGYITTNPNAPTIPAITVDGFVEEQSLARVDFIKIDVEGFEKAVLEGATRTIARHSPIVLMEFNCWCLTAHSRINPLDFAEWIFREFRFVHVVDSKTPHLHLRRPPPIGAIHYLGFAQPGSSFHASSVSCRRRCAHCPRHRRPGMHAVCLSRTERHRDGGPIDGLGRGPRLRSVGVSPWHEAERYRRPRLA